jgi:hypothetical protein
VQVSPGGLFHGNALDLAAGIACGGRHASLWIVMVFIDVHGCHNE